MCDFAKLDSTRLALLRPLLLIFGKASLRVFEVVDCVIILDSESVRLDSILCFCESLESVGLDSKPTLDSELALHSTLGLPSWHSKILDEKSLFSSEGCRELPKR